VNFPVAILEDEQFFNDFKHGLVSVSDSTLSADVVQVNADAQKWKVGMEHGAQNSAPKGVQRESIMNRTTLTSILVMIWVSMALPVMATESPSSALELAQQLNRAFVEVADRVSPSVVVITITQKRAARIQMPRDSQQDPPGSGRRSGEKGGGKHSSPRKHSSGSGIVISEDGYILTNNHVVENADAIRVRFQNGQEYDAEITGTDPESDVAVIKIKAQKLTAAVLGDSDKTRVGEFAIAIGAPFDLNYSVTVGHVSAKGRSFTDVESYTDQDYIQTDASINPGNSGGPLINLSGEVIGINAMIRPNSGIGFAIPINLAKRVKDHLIQEGRFVRSWLGTRIVDLKDYPALRALPAGLAPDVSEGVVVDQIEGDGPASKSDLKAGDVVTAIDGVAVKTSRRFKDEIASKKGGSAVKLATVRGSQHLEITVTVESLHAEDAKDTADTTESETADATEKPADATESKAKKTPAESSPDFGLTVETLTRKLAQDSNVEMVPGLLITAVDPGSLAYDQAVRVGDIITEVNRKPVTSVKQFQNLLKKTSSKDAVLFHIVSDGSSRIVVLKTDD
jgi:serine protease Do